ncbi:MAG: hypothetical protein AAGB26_08495 [Planctomycetota bacterium]
MKQRHSLSLLACFAFLLTACGESSSDDALPEGTAPTEPDRSEVTTPGETDEPDPAEYESTPEPEPVVEESPEPVLPPLPLPTPPASEDEAGRSSAPGLTYVLPEGWAIGPERQMRLLTLIPPDAGDTDLAISRWPGDVGGFASNVQRWARQAGLPPIPGLMTAAASDFEKFNIDGTTATWIPLMNEDANLAILAVWVPIGENPENPDQTWTFKLTCKADQVEALAPAVRAWCESIKFE